MAWIPLDSTLSSEPKVWEFFDYDPLVILPGKAVASFRAWDGAFDYFESSFLGSLPPQILFTIAGNKVNIITATGANLCSTELPDNLDPAAIQHFRTTATPAREVKGLPPPRSGLSTDDPETMLDILRFVIQQIYCGNEKAAWENLRTMWPAFDYSRIPERDSVSTAKRVS